MHRKRVVHTFSTCSHRNFVWFIGLGYVLAVGVLFSLACNNYCSFHILSFRLLLAMPVSDRIFFKTAYFLFFVFFFLVTRKFRSSSDFWLIFRTKCTTDLGIKKVCGKWITRKLDFYNFRKKKTGRKKTLNNKSNTCNRVSSRHRKRWYNWERRQTRAITLRHYFFFVQNDFAICKAFFIVLLRLPFCF